MMEIKKISDYEWEIPKTGNMKVPGKIFASEKLIPDKHKVFKDSQEIRPLLRDG